MPAIAITVLGAFWIALGSFAFALFFVMAPYAGPAGAAALTGLIFLLLVIILGLIIQQKIKAAKQNALIAGLASSGVANVVLGMVMKRPLLSLGIGGALAAFFLRGAGK